MFWKIKRRFSRIKDDLSTKVLDSKINPPVIIPRSSHIITRKNISHNALKVLNRLNRHGHKAYLVGGGVRDLLLDREPKDFDIATDAHPEQVRELFRNCRLIGRRFRLAHILFGKEIIEVATFRASHGENEDKHDETKSAHSATGQILRDNVYGTIEEDVLRRDFTINALYYDIADFSLVDYVDGLQDIEKRQLRLIGDATTRYQEDPVRMLRAVRFASKLNFEIHPDAEKPLKELAPLLTHISVSRLFEEYLKLFFTGAAYNTYKKLEEHELFDKLFPYTSATTFIELALKNTDERIAQRKTIAPGFLLAVFLWESLCDEIKAICGNNKPTLFDVRDAADIVVTKQRKTTSVPKYFQNMIKDIWALQFILKRREGRRASKTFMNPKFRGAFDFLILRSASGDQEAAELAKWWQQYIDSSDEIRWQMAKSVTNKKKSAR